jgi:hypothetical protein
VAGRIVLARGAVDCSDYRGRAELFIDPIFVPGQSCLAVQTLPSTCDLAEKRAFQDGVLHLLRRAGLLGSGSYRLLPARRQALPTIHFFGQLHRNRRDMLEAFCLGHGSIMVPQPATALRRSTDKRFSFRHRLVVNATSERAARILAAGALPNTELWSQFELTHFKLEHADHECFTFAVEITFTATDEDRARAMVVDLLAPLVKAEDTTITSLSGPSRSRPSHNGRPERRRNKVP